MAVLMLWTSAIADGDPAACRGLPLPGETMTSTSDSATVHAYRLEAAYAIGPHCAQHWTSQEASRDTHILRVATASGGGHRETFRRSVTTPKVWIDDHPDVVLGSDITNNGRSNLVVGAGSRTACCHGFIVLELGDELRVLYDDFAAGPEGHGGALSRTLIDLDRSGSRELIAIDDVSLAPRCSAHLSEPLSVRTVFRYEGEMHRFVEASGRFPQAFAADIAHGHASARRPSSPIGDDARLCGVLPLVLALVAAGHLAEAWEAFDEHYDGHDAAAHKAWLQHVLLTQLAWRHQPSFGDLAGLWIGEMAQFVRQPETGEFDLMGGGHMIAIEIFGDAPIGWPVGTWMNFGRGDRELTCTLLRSEDGPHHLSVRGDCEDEMTLQVQARRDRTLEFAYIGSDVHEDLRDEGYAVRSAELPWVAAALLTQRLMRPEQMFASSCLGLQRSRNEIFARRGWVFGPGSVADHFASQAWYRPRGDLTNRDVVNAAVVAGLTDVERVDVRTLLSYERHVGCGATLHPDPTLRRGPSFACGAASRWDEHIICSSPLLSEFDALVAAVHAEVATSGPADADSVWHGQQRWWERRLACQAAVNPVACLRQTYVARLDELRVLMVAP